MNKTVNTFAALGEALGIKSSVRKPQKEWAEKQQEKFLKCPKCGGRMNLVAGTNIVICSNEIIVKDKNETHTCGYTRTLDADSVGFANYIFS